jgi:putative ABC transport system permease protein
VTVVGTLAVVIALNTAVFALVDAVWLSALPFAESDRLVVVGRMRPTSSSARPGRISVPEFLDWTERSQDFDGLAAVSIGYGLMAAEVPGGVRSIDVAAVTPNLFPLFGVGAKLGRTFEPADVAAGHTELIVLGHTFWQGAFQGEPNVIGRKIRLAWFDDSKEYEVSGVMPRDFQIRFPKAHDAYIPAPTFAVERGGPARRASAYEVFGKLQSGRSIGAVRATMRDLGDALNREYPTNPQSTTVEVMPVYEYFFGRTRPILIALAGAAGFILLLACANISSMLLSATLDRSAELATRAALGAGRWRLTAMLVAEHATLGAAGSLAGLALASASVAVLRHIAPPELPRIDTMAIDWRVAAVSVALAAMATLASALFPAWRFGRVKPADELRSGGRSLDAGTRRAQGVLMTGQIALVVLLLLGAGVMAGSLRELLKIDLGFKPEGLIALRARFLRQNYGPAGAVVQDRLTREVLSRAGVLSAGWTSELPLGVPDVVRVRLRHLGGINPRYRIVSAGYLETVGASLLRGRLFEHRDRDGEPVAVVNRSFVAEYFAGRDPLEEEVFVTEWYRIVGVVDDIREGPLEDSDTPTIYWQFSGRHWMAGAPWLTVRVRDPKQANPEALRVLVASVDPGLPVAATERLIDRVMQQTARTRFLSAALGGIATVALLIAAGGIFGMTAYSVRRRRQELGLRMALGADRRAVAWQVLGGLAAITAFGMATGLGLSWMVNRWIRAFLFGVGPNDPVVAAIVVALLALVIVTSCLVPLRSALAIEPAEALRRE